MMAGFPAAYLCIKAFSETDQTEDLKKFDVPTLVIQGDDDQIVPFADAGALQAKLVKGATLKVYKGAPHGLCTTHRSTRICWRSSRPRPSGLPEGARRLANRKKWKLRPGLSAPAAAFLRGMLAAAS
jgi:fermentation-respiration switch protein FrsA (DUF1100 family)